MDTLTEMQKAIHEFHKTFNTVHDFIMKKKPEERMSKLDIDYDNADQDFYLRIFTGLTERAAILSRALDYLDKPIRKQGILMYDYAEGKFKLDGEYILDGILLEALINNQWYIVQLQGRSLINVLKRSNMDIEPKGLTVRIR